MFLKQVALNFYGLENEKMSLFTLGSGSSSGVSSGRNEKGGFFGFLGKSPEYDDLNNTFAEEKVIYGTPEDDLIKGASIQGNADDAFKGYFGRKP